LISHRLFIASAQRFEDKEEHDAFGIDFAVAIFGIVRLHLPLDRERGGRRERLIGRLALP
jgi:hypothetical protein